MQEVKHNISYLVPSVFYLNSLFRSIMLIIKTLKTKTFIIARTERCYIFAAALIASNNLLIVISHQVPTARLACHVVKRSNKSCTKLQNSHFECRAGFIVIQYNLWLCDAFILLPWSKMCHRILSKPLHFRLNPTTKIPPEIGDRSPSTREGYQLSNRFSPKIEWVISNRPCSFWISQ